MTTMATLLDKTDTEKITDTFCYITQTNDVQQLTVDASSRHALIVHERANTYRRTLP